jgi:LytR cell envelope-related transcriptional attenuator
MDWLDLLTPSAAILALLAALALVVQSIRQGRQIRQLEQRVSEGGGSATKASLERIAQLQARSTVSQGGLGPGLSVGRRAGVIGACVLVLALIGGGTWFLFFRDDGGGGTSGAASRPSTPASGRTRVALPPERDRVPATVPPLRAPKSTYTVAILNGSGVTGAARSKIRPLLVSRGYTAGNVGDAPTSTVKTSIVYWPRGGNPNVAYNVAHDLGIKRATKNDGVPQNLYGNADAVVIIGKDLAG